MCFYFLDLLTKLCRKNCIFFKELLGYTFDTYDPLICLVSTNCSHDAEEEPEGEFDTQQQQQQPIVKGDTVNLHQLLFTKSRDYLVKYNDDRQVPTSSFL